MCPANFQEDSRIPKAPFRGDKNRQFGGYHLPRYTEAPKRFPSLSSCYPYWVTK